MQNQETSDTVIYPLATVVSSSRLINVWNITATHIRLPVSIVRISFSINFLVSYFQNWSLEIVISENEAAFSKLIVMQIRIFPLLWNMKFMINTFVIFLTYWSIA